MNPKTIVLRNCTLNYGIFRLCARRCYSSDPFKEEVLDIAAIDVTPQYLDEITEKEQEELAKKRLKSRLTEAHRRILNGVRPYDENVAWFHNTIRYKQRMLGRFGMEAMDVPIGSVWPTEEEIEDKLLWEKTGYPKTIQERWLEIEERHRREDEEIRHREDEITKKLALVSKWQKDLKAKIAQKEATIAAAKEKRMRLLEEVRREFGFAVDPRDERFKALIEQKEKEDKKRNKEAKKKERAARYIAQMMETIKTEGSPETKQESDKKIDSDGKKNS